MLRKLSVVRKASLTSAPTTIASTIAGHQRQLAQAEGRGAAAARRPAGRSSSTSTRLGRHAPTPSIAATSSSLAPARAELGREPALEDHQHAVADRQLVQLVGDDQHAGAGRAGAARRSPNSASLEAMSTPCVGYSSTSTLRRGGERPAHHRLLLVAAAELVDRLLGRGGHDLRASHQAAAAGRACRPGSTMPAGPSRSTMVIVRFSATESCGTMPRRVAVARHVADALAARVGHTAAAQRPRRRRRISPAAGATRPAMASPISLLARSPRARRGRRTRRRRPRS